MDIGTAFPFIARTHLESPALATYKVFSLMNNTLAVQPISSAPLTLMIYFVLAYMLAFNGDFPFKWDVNSRALYRGDYYCGNSAEISISCFFPTGVERSSSIFKKVSLKAYS